MTQTYDGGCTCGALRYRITSAPMFIHACHCTSCQRETGGAFAINAMIETDRVCVLDGEIERIATPSESGRGQTIVRCAVCHVAVWSHYSGLGEKAAFVRVGTLDDRAVFTPDMHIFTRSKVRWLELPEGARAVEVYYDTEKEWPAESLARRAALMR